MRIDRNDLRVRAIIKQNGRYLLARRKGSDSGGGLWQFIGGKAEGMKPLLALKKEVKEEANLGVERANRRFIQTGGIMGKPTYYYDVKAFGKLKFQRAELSGLDFFSRRDALKLPLTGGAKKAFRSLSKSKYPLQSRDWQIKRALFKANNMLNANLNKKEMAILRRYNRHYDRKMDSHNIYQRNGGGYHPSREAYHQELIRKRLSTAHKYVDKKDPDFYYVAGMPASGKSTVVRRYIPKKTLVISADDYKEDMTERHPSPIRRYKLAHAEFLHEESSHIADETIRKAKKRRMDIALDATFSDIKKNTKLVKSFKRAGYDTHLVGTQFPTSRATVGVVVRFLKSGRYTPPHVVAKKGNSTNRNVMHARKAFDTYRIFDTTNPRRPVLIARSRRRHTDNIRNPRR